MLNAREKKVAIIVLKYLNMALRMSSLERVRNNNLRKRCLNRSDLLEQMDHNILKWFGCDEDELC